MSLVAILASAFVVLCIVAGFAGLALLMVDSKRTPQEFLEAEQ